MNQTIPAKRILEFVEIESRRSCNAFIFRDMITDERIEVTGKGLKKLFEDLGIIGLVLDEGKKAPSNTKEPRPTYHTVLNTAFGDKNNGTRQVIPSRRDSGKNRNRHRR